MKMKKGILIWVVLISLLTFYFSGVGFELGVLGQALFALATFGILYWAGQGGWERFYLVALVSLSTAASLGCAFYNPGEVTGPFVSSLRFGPVVILCLTAIVSVGALLWYKKSLLPDKFSLILLLSFALNWIILGINVRFFDDWKMENWLTVPFVVLIYIAHRWFKLSNVSYGLIFAYMMLHIYGSHYTYSEVPFGIWMQNFFEIARNHYDRIVHFSFGFLLAYPLRELILRVSDAKGFWGFWFPIEFVLAFSAVYELLEWLIVILFGGDLGVAYLGSQGDIWDAQKDIFLAGLGSLIAMTVVLLILWHYKGREFWHEFRESLRVKSQKILGEEALRDLAK